MQRGIATGVTGGVIVKDVGDVTLLPKLDRAAPVAAGKGVAHLVKKLAKGIRVWACEFDEGETIRARRIFWADDGFCSAVWEGAHSSSFHDFLDHTPPPMRCLREFYREMLILRGFHASLSNSMRVFLMLDETDTRLLAELQRDALMTAEILGAKLKSVGQPSGAAQAEAGIGGLHHWL